MPEFIENFQRPSLVEIKQDDKTVRLPDYDTLVRILYRDRADIYALLKIGQQAGSGVLASSDQSDQGAAIASTVIYTPTATGRFAVRAYALCAAAGAGTVSFFLSWTDQVKAQSQTLIANLSLVTLGTLSSGEKIVRAIAGQPIAFSTTVAGMAGGAQYDLSIGVEAA